MRGAGLLTLFCGKMGAGKSTRSSLIAAQKNAVLISEDEWISTLYPDKIHSFDDYLRYSAILKPLVKHHVKNILSTGTNVVMDFPANTKAQRKWFLDLVSEVGADHELVFINLDDDQCLKQIAQRCKEQPERSEFDTEAVFYHVSQYFEAPSEDEGFNITEVVGSA